KLRPPFKATGLRRWLVVLSPSCPEPFRPQQKAAALVRTPQVNLSPAATATYWVDAPPEACGVLAVVVLPRPYWPVELSPQQKSAPPLAMPQVWLLPAMDWAAMLPKVCPVLTAVGALRGVLLPTPSSPKVLLPQQ